MNAKQFRNLAFFIHRYLGLALGLLLIFIGITGSLLVFEPEIEDWAIARQFGTVIPQEQTISIDRVAEIAQTTYPDWDLVYIRWSDEPHQPLILRMIEPAFDSNIYMDGEHQVFIDPYIGEVLGDRKVQLPNTIQLDSYFRVDAAVFYRHNNYELALNFKNLTDTEYYSTQGFYVTPEAPFTVLGNISVKF